MIKAIKDLIKKNQTLADICRELIFFKDLFPKDVFNIEKLKLFKKVYPYTMVSYKRLSNIYDLAKSVEKNKEKGAFVECGVWRGGCAAVMGFVADRAQSKRKVWLFDSFEGLPEPTKEDGDMARDYAHDRIDGKLKTIDKCVGPLEDVKRIIFEILDLKLENIKIKKGWFQDTLPGIKNEVGPVAILRLDGDWYESTKCCLANLYDNVTTGGYVIIDDYSYWEGSSRALGEFFSERKISPELIKIDDAGIYFRKP